MQNSQERSQSGWDNRTNHVDRFLSLDQKRIEEEKSETASESGAARMSSSFCTGGSRQPAVTEEDEVVDLKSLKQRILDRNYTHIFDKAKEAAKGSSLLSPFGPKLGQQCRGSVNDSESQFAQNQLKQQYQESLRRQRELKSKISAQMGELGVDEDEAADNLYDASTKRESLANPQIIHQSRNHQDDFIS